MNIKTIALQNMVAKVIKGVGSNKLIPITSMIGIKVEDEKLTLMSTDATSYLSVFSTITEHENAFECTVDADIFAKLISKLTSEYTEMELDDNTLIIIANGTYKIAVQFDENGDGLIFPQPKINESALNLRGHITPEDVKLMNDVIKPSLSSNVGSCYANYIIGEFVVATDRAMLSAYNKSFFEMNYLYTRQFVELLSLSSNEWKIMQESDDTLLATDESGTQIYTKLIANKDISDFSVDGVKKMLALEYDSYCKVKKAELLSTLERIAIFVSAYDDSVVNVTFTQDGIEVFSKQDRGAELVEYMEVKDFRDYSMKIDINRWIAQIKAYQSDSIDLYFGNPMCIKMTDGNITQVIALIA